MRDKVTAGLAAALGLFTLYTAAAGPYVSLIQRPVFLALAICLGLAIYPLWEGRRLRPLGLALDLLAAAVTLVACAYVVVHQDRIMTELPWAGLHDQLLTLGVVLVVLEISRRAIGLVFPLLVLAGLGYALFGQHLPGALGHRGFGPGFVTETLFLGDLGLWGLLLGVAATTIAAFVLFGAMILHTGGGQTFIDLAMRLGGRSPGGAAKIATIASAFFATVSGSAVANTATTGNFTIPMMKRLGYPPAFAGAVEAVASTGGQIAPPVLGAAAFLMVEIIGVSYLRIMGASVLPALLFFLAVFLTVHIYAVQRGLRIVPDDELPAWSRIGRASRLVPLIAALGGLFAGVLTGHSIQTAAFWGICGQVGCYLAFGLAGGQRPAELGRKVLAGLVDGGKGLVIIGVLLAGAQILVSMINLTGVGVTISGAIAGAAGGELLALAAIVALVCLVMGMGIPTTAAYVLVAAVMTPALIAGGVPELTAHMFVFYFATLSVITPPVCVGVFVAAGIAGAGWLAVARDAFRLAAVTYVIPFLFIVYPGMLGGGGWIAIGHAVVSGLVFVLASALFFGGQPITGRPWLDRGLLLLVAVLALVESWLPTLLAVTLLVALLLLSRRRRAAAADPAAGS